MFTPRPTIGESSRDNAWKNVVTKNLNQLMDGSGWIPVGDDLSLSSVTSNPTTYVCNLANADQKFQVGDKIRLTHSSATKYFYVVAVTSTTVSLWSGSSHTLDNQAISSVAYSRLEKPWVFPDNKNYTKGLGDGWIPVSETWTCTTAMTFPTRYVIALSSDARLRFQVGDRVRLTHNGAVKYFYIYAVNETSIGLNAGSSYVLDTTNAISNISVSRDDRPWGFPAYFEWNPNPGAIGTNASWSASGTVKFTLHGTDCFFTINIAGALTGTSITELVAYLPISCPDLYIYWPVRTLNGIWRCGAAWPLDGNRMHIYRDTATPLVNWDSGSANAYMRGSYHIL